MRRFLVALAAPALLSAHDMVVRVEPGPATVILRATYDGADPAGRADVQIFKPGDAHSPYQTGSTDAAGAFAFVPSQPGVWTAVVDDGYGHRAETQVEWTVDAAQARLPADAHHSNWRNALTGVSLLIGLTGIWLWRQSRKGTAGTQR